MRESELKESIQKAVDSCEDNPFDIENRPSLAEGLYQSFLANQNLMSQLGDLSYEDLEAYIHRKMLKTETLLKDLDTDTLEHMSKFPIPPKKA